MVKKLLSLVIFLFLVIFAHPWSCYHGNPQRTGLSPFVFGDSFEIAWTYNVGAQISGSAVVARGEKIIFGARDGYLYCLNENGELLWRSPLSYTVWFSTPALDDTFNIYITDGRRLFKFDSTGRELWSWPSHNNLSISHSPVIGQDGKIYFACYSDSLYALTPNGDLAWARALGSDVNSSPTIGYDGKIYVATTRGIGNWILWAFNPDGSVAWAYPLAGEADFATPAVGPDSTIYVGADSFLYAIRADGTLKWRTTLSTKIQTCPAVANDSTIYVNAYNLYCLDARSGRIRWVLPGIGSDYCAPAIDARGNVFFGSNRVFYIVGPDGSIRCSRIIASSQSLFASPAISANHRIYIGHMNGNFYAFQGYPASFVEEYRIIKKKLFFNFLTQQVDKEIFKLYDLSGKLIKTNSSLKALPSGIYYLYYQKNKEKYFQKVIIK